MTRRAFLKAAGLVGIGLAGTPWWTGWTGSRERSNAAVAATPSGDPIGDLAAALDYDAERIFRFVADEVRYDPYSGILRGARGTLASRAGNSVDQALLLAALLDASLLPYRFATGELDADAADALLAGTVAEADSIRAHALDALAGTIPGVERPPVALTSDQQQLLDQALARGEQVVTWARDQLEATISTLQSALKDAGIDVLDSFSRLPDSERARHTWVQLAQTADWLDLDPTLSGAAPGTAPATISETLETLPEELAHLVELAIIGETLGPDGLSEQRLLGYSERADILAGLPIAVSNTTPEALSGLGLSIAGVLGGGDAYAPVLIVGDEAVVGSTPIQFAPETQGSVDDAPAGAASTQAGAAAPETTAEWVELTIRSPETPPIVVRREIFDRIGPARRAAGGVTGTVLAPVERLELADGSGTMALPAMTTHWLTVNTGIPGRDDPVLATATVEDNRGPALASEAWHLLKTVAGLELAVPAGLRPFVDAPNVTAYSLLMHPDANGSARAETALDIWHRSHGVTGVAGATASVSPMLTAGVLAHLAERVMGGDALQREYAPAAMAPVSVGAVFDQAEAAGVPIRVLRGPGATADLSWDDDARARLEVALADGWVAIAPERPVLVGARERVGWWLIDPRTGGAVDQLDDGRGGVLGDYLGALRVWYEALPAYVHIGVCIFTLARGMYAFLVLAMRTAEGKSVLTPTSLLSAGGLGSAVWSFGALGC